MHKDTKQVIVSILIGACVAFLSSLFDGLVSMLQGQGNNILGASSATLAYLKKTNII